MELQGVAGTPVPHSPTVGLSFGYADHYSGGTTNIVILAGDLSGTITAVTYDTLRRLPFNTNAVGGVTNRLKVSITGGINVNTGTTLTKLEVSWPRDDNEAGG